MMESCLIESCGNALLKTFASKNSYSENSQVLGNAAYNFKVFTNKAFTILADLFADQCDWIYILLYS